MMISAISSPTRTRLTFFTRRNGFCCLQLADDIRKVEKSHNKDQMSNNNYEMSQKSQKERLTEEEGEHTLQSFMALR